MSRNDRLFSYVLSAAVIIVLSIVGYLQLDEFARIEDFPLYRQAFNLAKGNGLVFNPAEDVWPTVSPMPGLLLGGAMRLAAEWIPLRFSYIYLLATGLWAISYGVASGLLYSQLRRIDLKSTEAAIVSTGWLLVWPIWAGFRSPAPLTMIFILLALTLHERGRWAGLMAGLAIATQPEGILGALVVGIIVVNDRRFWQTVWIPIAIWAISSAFIYDDSYLEGLTTGQLVTEGQTLQNLLWVGLLAASAAVLFAAKIKNWLWAMVLWAALEIGARLLVYGDLTQVQSAPLALSIAAALVIGSRFLGDRQVLGMGSGLGLLAILLLVNPPRTDKELSIDMQLGETLLLPADSDLITDRSIAILANMDDFDGNLYQLDGNTSLLTRNFVERKDYESFVIATAPRYIYINANTSVLTEIDLKALNYRKELDLMLDPGQREGDQLWIQRTSPPDFGATQAVDLSFSPDVQLVGYAIDQQRISLGDPIRVRLDWRLDRRPTDEITVQISLLDHYQGTIASAFPTFAASVWEPLELSTYHMLAIPNEIDNPGVANILVALDYKSAILDRHSFGSLVVNIPQPEQPPTEPMGRIANVVLYDDNVSQIEDRLLQIDLQWGLVESSLERDYQVLVHLRQLESGEPKAFGDGPPFGGRYPTSLWQPGEVIPDTHLMQLTDEVVAGEYELVVGFYILETFEPLGNTLTIKRIMIDDDGTVTVVAEDS